jgi:site-specific DNA-methyltransferase (adenine-specific)
MISEVYNMDCMVGMKQYPDKYFDLAIVDPPYFYGPNKRMFYGRKVNKLNIRRKDYDLIERWDIPDHNYYNDLIRVSKHQIIWGINYFRFYNIPTGRIVWDKVNQSSSFSDCEIASCSFNNSVRLFRYMWNGMLQGKCIKEGHLTNGNKSLNEKRIHPTQKPVKFYEWLLKNYAKQGDRILDTHLGSGSSRIAAHNMGFDFIGFELDKNYYEAQEKRFKQHIKQLTLF